VQIVVVGAGVVGCAVAHELASRGARVQVIDPRGIGLGATQASAGILAPHIEGHSAESGSDAASAGDGAPLALRDLGVKSLALYDGFIDRIRSESGRSVEYDRSGSLQIALNDEEARALQTFAAGLARDGVPHAPLCPRDARALEPGLSDQIASALLIPLHGYVAASALTSALGLAAQALGATFASARVESVASSAGAIRVVTDGGTIESQAVVVAAGSWSSLIGAAPRQVAPPVKPVRGQLLHLRRRRRPASRVIWHEASERGAASKLGPSYAVPWADGSVLVGATVEDVGFDEHQTPDAVAQLRAESVALLPETADAVLHAVRVGLRPSTPDGLPLVGPSSTMPNLFYATGHYRSGVLLAPLTAALVADFILDGRRDPALEHTRPDRFGW
jgi:glycine oxidase